MSLVFALPSKGRLQEQAEAWLAECGLRVRRDGGSRGYSARLEGAGEIEVRLISAREIAGALETGDVHVGVTGEDVIREESADPDGRIVFLAGLGFGAADLVVATPQSWLDVRDMHDLEDVAARERARRGRQLRVATKYHRLTRAFFFQHGLDDYQIVDSHGATEGAPAAGVADVIVDITSSGATLAANHLRPLDDGVILRSQAQLVLAKRAAWTPDAIAALKDLLDIIAARQEGRENMVLRGAHAPQAWRAAADAFGAIASPDGHGATCARSHAFAAAALVRDATGAPVTVTPAAYVFLPDNALFTRAKTAFSASDL